MSEFGAILDRLELHWRAADASLPTGENGFERDVRLAADLTAGEMPHVFAHDPNETTSRLPLRQVERTVTVQLDYWVRCASQEDTAAVLDAFRDAVDDDPTLDGAVDDAYISTRAVVDAQFAGKPERVGVVLVTTTKVAQ